MTKPASTNPSRLCQCGCGAHTTSTRHRFLMGHQSRKPGPRVTVTESGCHIWHGATNGVGYGHVKRNGRNISAHRAAWEDRHGPVPDGMELDHACRNRGCVNPDHLEPVTHAVNARRGARAKLTPDAAARIRESSDPASAVAVQYGVHPQTVYDIRAGRRWARP
jgi:hypothetical protein